MWVRVLEAWLTARLLSSPTFHRGVHAVAKKVRQLRHGKDPEEMGGTNIERSGDSDAKKFLDHYLEELKDQFRGGSSTKK
ncbi:MAG: hypothetical protein FRX48_07474 [Lasallia pustulata]|nr:MAG: hypothetical protein FRX48_07474 [Lasallia pustulata]